MRKTIAVLGRAFGSLTFNRIANAFSVAVTLLCVWSIGRYGPDYLSVVAALLGIVAAMLSHIACEEATFYEGVDWADEET